MENVATKDEIEYLVTQQEEILLKIKEMFVTMKPLILMMKGGERKNDMETHLYPHLRSSPTHLVTHMKELIESHQRLKISTVALVIPTQ